MKKTRDVVWRKRSTVQRIALANDRRISSPDHHCARDAWGAVHERQLQDAAGIIKMQRETLDFGYIEEWVATLQLHRQWAALQELAG